MNRLRAFLLALAVLPLGGWKPLWRMDPDVVEGNRAYQEGRYDDALAAYDRAKDSGVDDAGLAYDRGTAILGKAEATGAAETFAEAFTELGKATHGKDKLVAARAHYNRGNIAMRGKQLDDAIEEYKDALRADPTLESARSNLELALRQREKQRKQQQQQGGQGQPQQGQGNGQQPQPQPGQGNGQQPPPQPPQGQGNGQQPQPQPGQGNGQQPPPQPQPGQQGQQGNGGQGPSQRRMPPAQWPHDDTESDTPDTAPSAKLDQLEDMSRQLRRDQVKQHNDANGQPDQDW